MLRRDTYHDYITDAELQDVGPGVFFGTVMPRIRDLNQRSGAHQVANSVTYTHEDIQNMVMIMEVRFDSAGWTGR